MKPHLRPYVAWAALTALWLTALACNPPATHTDAAKPTRFRLSASQIEAIQAAPKDAVVTGWVDTTVWVQINGAKPLDEAHICPPWTDC